MSAPVLFVKVDKKSTYICNDEDSSILLEIPVVIATEEYRLLMIRCFTAGWQGGEKFGRLDQKLKARAALKEVFGI